MQRHLDKIILKINNNTETMSNKNKTDNDEYIRNDNKLTWANENTTTY
jgi:hypothetical protein